MDTKKYATRIQIELDTVGTPDYVITLDGQVANLGIEIELDPGPHLLEITHLNKLPSDPDTAVIIKSITFNDIASDKFVWAGIYTPNYPEPWASTQTNLSPTLTNTGYLGWNGTWRLQFTAPIFTWIHNIEDLGWIYS